MSVDLNLSRSNRIYRPNEPLEGKIVIKSPSSFSHAAIRLTVNGSVTLQIRGGSAGVIESLYGVLKPISIVNKSVEVKSSGRIGSGTTEVSCQIVKLVLRNNAISTLHGIENLKSLEGLDLSYNLISNFSELEILSGLPSLQNLWLEGNPLCCARWYRAQVFSFFRHPDKKKLDEKKIGTREFWKSQIIIASRQKRPASFGFYSPAKDDAEVEGTINTKRKKHSRLASIECEEQTMHMGSDQDSVSCENETLSKEENDIADVETEIVGLMNRIEYMKKERSALWLQEFKDWLNQESENFMDNAKYNAAISNRDHEHNLNLNTRQRHRGESSRCVSDSFQASGDESSITS